MCVGPKAIKTQANLKRCTCVSVISLSAPGGGGGGGGLRVVPIQKGGYTHAQIPLDELACALIGPALLACGCMCYSLATHR